jgi:hypothetical protein
VTQSVEGETFVLLVRLYQSSDGTWRIDMHGTHTIERLRLLPATFLVQLWRAADAELLRGTIELCGSERSAVLQGNGELIDLLQAWMYPEIHFVPSAEKPIRLP